LAAVVFAAVIVPASDISDEHSALGTLRVSVAVVSSCAVATRPGRASVRCGAAVKQPLQQFDADNSIVTIDF
jgi:hypothetical protein